MAEIIKETITTKGNNSPNPVVVNSPTQPDATNTQTAEYLVYYLFGALEILLAFRLIFKLMGAGTGSAFIRFIYGLTGLFILPFNGIFSRGISPGLETSSILEPGTLIAIVVYIILAWGIVKLVRISSGKQQET